MICKTMKRHKILFMISLGFSLTTELIYNEVMDWEERNKNGVLKEECLGESRTNVKTV